MHQVGLEMRDAALKKTNENFLPSWNLLFNGGDKYDINKTGK